MKQKRAAPSPSHPPEQELFDADETARILGLRDRRAVYRLRVEGRLGYYMINDRHYRHSRAQIDEFLKSTVHRQHYFARG
ncbi:MAG: helix-turn-helix domain-containing protein [Actinomycetota bacterium]